MHIVNDRINVEYECYTAVTKDGCCSYAADLTIVRFETLDDDLPLTLNCVDEQCSSASTLALNQKGDAFSRVERRSTIP